ncbi:hypothetical protein CHS0354_021678 [Potamilus streckersoni]|uniref:CCR4-NOT transcription complex subunit 2 n=1 Tax=Potamilus streckersoni TaxID=2493646 RepID=A0AAE0SI25_9BIVA|nr:hypothetical protein CHS0354_021678 [Potamilus streckersoni]
MAYNNPMDSAFRNSMDSSNMISGIGQFGLGRKSSSELSPGSKKVLSGMPPLPHSMTQNLVQSFAMSGQVQQQSVLNQPPKTRKSGGFFDEDDSETSMFFPPSNMFRGDKEILTQAQSPSQLSGFSTNFFNQGGLAMFNAQQRGGVSGPQFQRNNAPTPTSMNPNFQSLNLQQQSSPSSRGIISAIGQQRMINQPPSSQAMSSMQKRPIGSLGSIGSGLSSTAATQMSNLGQAFFSQSRGNEGSQPNFDLSEFPTLGNRTISSSNPIQAPRNYGMVSKPVQEQTPEFTIQQEDFPALPGAQSTLSMFVSDPTSSSGSSSDLSRKTPINLISGSSFEQSSSKDGKFPGDKQTGGPYKRGIVTHQDGTVSNIPAGMVTDQFGIVGLLTFIKAAETDPNLIALAPGMDLTTLGLNLNSPENLYSTFQSPWVDMPCRPQDIDFHVPAEYLTNIFIRDKLAPIKLNRYTEDLLFFLFYMNGGDVLQLAAAAELYTRDWRYHKDERVWITRAPGVEPIVKTNTYERGTYYFFDAQNWRKVAKEFYLEYDKLEDKPSLPPTLHHNPNQMIPAH